MAKGPSKSTADVHGRSGGWDEYRRSGSRARGTTGTEDPDQAVPGSLSDPPGTYGEPVAVKVARRVREAVRGNGPVERPEPRPGPTSQHAPPTPIAPSTPARRAHSPATGATLRPLRRDRLGGLVHEYVQAHDLTGFSAPQGSTRVTYHESRQPPAEWPDGEWPRTSRSTPARSSPRHPTDPRRLTSGQWLICAAMTGTVLRQRRTSTSSLDADLAREPRAVPPPAPAAVAVRRQ
jgi:hypothetical protein